MQKIYSNKEIEIILVRNGFEMVEGGKGSHFKFKKGDKVVSLNFGSEIATVVFLRECREKDIDIRMLDKKYWKTHKVK